MKRNTNQRNLLVLTNIHNTKKQNKTNTTETKPETPPTLAGPQAWGTDSKQPQEPLGASHLIHEDLHLHQPRVGVPRCPVGYHPSKGNQGSGLAAELLRERGRREEIQLTSGSGHCPENHHPGLPFSTPWGSGQIPGGWMTVSPSTIMFLQHGAELAKLGCWGLSSKAFLLSKRWMGVPGKLPHLTRLTSCWHGPVLQTACSTSLSLSLSPGWFLSNCYHGVLSFFLGPSWSTCTTRGNSRA